MAICSLACYCKKVSNALNATQKEILDSLSHEAQIMQTVICQTKWDEQAIIQRWNKNRWSEKCLEDDLLAVKECSIPQRHLFLVFPDVFCRIFVDPFFLLCILFLVFCVLIKPNQQFTFWVEKNDIQGVIRLKYLPQFLDQSMMPFYLYQEIFVSL